MLKAMGGNEMYEYTQQTTRQTLEKIGLNPTLIDELVTVVMRIYYGQDVTLNGFAGMEEIQLNLHYAVTPGVPANGCLLEFH